MNIWFAWTNRQNWVEYFACENDLCRAMLPDIDCLGTLSSTLCQISAFEGGNWVICLWQHYISTMGYFKCTILFNICTISFLSYYDIGTLVVPCLDNIFMVLLISALGNFNIGATKPFFLDSGSPRGGGVHSCLGMVCYHCLVHVLNSSKKL